VDLYGPLTRTAAGHRFIPVITDRFTKLVRALPMDGTMAVDCASVVLDDWVATCGPPDRLLSDEGPQFTSHVWGQVCNLLSIEPKVTSPSLPQTSGQTERFNRPMHTILNHYVAVHPRSWDHLLGALTLTYDSRPHRSTRVAPLELINPMGVSSWAFKDVSRAGAYPRTAQRGTAAEKQAQADLLTRLVQLVPQMWETLKAPQGRYKRDHDGHFALRAEKLTVGGCAWLRDHAKEEGAGGKPRRGARGSYSVVSTDVITVLLDVDGEHRRENVAHVVRSSGAAVPGPAQHPALRTARSSMGQRPMASGTPWTGSRTTPRCPTEHYGSTFTGPGTPSPPGWRPRTPRTRRCASICAAPRAWDYPIRPPNRRQRPRVPRTALLGPPQASLPRRPQPFATDPLGRRGGRVRTGGGGGVFRGGARGLSGHWVTRTGGHGASTPRGSAASTRTHSGNTRRKPAALRQGRDGLMPPKQARHLRG